jgi:hypothetical protein
MSYVGYIPTLKSFLHQLPEGYSPSILEVGVDRGCTLIPLVAFLARTRPAFNVMGIDVIAQEQVRLVVQNLDLQREQRVFLPQENSLDALPKLVAQGIKFDVVLLDGDHNYHTVSEELRHLEALTHDHSIVICDDYSGRWAERDLWYAERPGYEGSVATHPIDTGKHGVKPAVDEWLLAHPEWCSQQPIKGEPVVLAKQTRLEEVK